MVGRRREPEGDAEVGRSDVHRVDARYGEDLVDMSDGVAGLDHHDAENVLVGVREVVEARVVVRSHRPVAAAPAGA